MMAHREAVALAALLLVGGAVLRAAPGAAQPIIIPLSPQARDAPKPPPPSPVPVAPPQAEPSARRGTPPAVAQQGEPPDTETGRVTPGGEGGNRDRE